MKNLGVTSKGACPEDITEQAKSADVRIFRPEKQQQYGFFPSCPFPSRNAAHPRKRFPAPESILEM
ncbi:MAG: hypothetical protein ACLSUW_04250 [Akkermansia sp.]